MIEQETVKATSETPKLTEAEVLKASTKKEHTVKRILEERLADVKVLITQRLDQIEKDCQARLKEINDRNKTIQGFIMREVLHDVSNNVHNMQITMDAFVEVLNENAIKIEELDKKLDAKKVEINERRTKQAEEKMKERMAGQPESSAEPQKLQPLPVSEDLLKELPEENTVSAE